MFLLQCLGKILADSQRFCEEGVYSTDNEGQVRRVVCRLAAYVMDRMEAEAIVGCTSQTCFRCTRARKELWRPGKLPTDVPRWQWHVEADIQAAKTHGTWPARPGQAGADAQVRQDPRPLWSAATLSASDQCKERFKTCCGDLRVTPQTFEYNALFEVPFFDSYQQVRFSNFTVGPTSPQCNDVARMVQRVWGFVAFFCSSASMQYHDAWALAHAPEPG